MKKFLSTKLLIATFTILFISKASADVTTQDVWNKLRSFITSSEFELTATETQTHGVLKINELFFSRTLPNKNFGQGLQLSLSFSSLRFTQNSDGTVTILLPKHSNIITNLSIITPHKILNVCSYHKHKDRHHTNVYVILLYNDSCIYNLCISFFFSFLVGKILYLIFLTKYQKNLKFCIYIYPSF